MADKIKLSSGALLPVLGLGTYAPVHGEEEIITAVKAAVRAGYRHIDCAAIYRNERAVGRAIKELIVEGAVKREDLYVASKLWNTCHRTDLVESTLKKTLEDLGLDYIDLYLIHWPMAYKEGGDFNPKDENGKTLYSEVDFVDTWKAMEDCRDMGKTKDIGLSNFNSKQIQRIFDNARVPPVALQVEINCHLSNEKLVAFAQEKGLAVVAFAPIGVPSNDHKETKLLDEPVIKEIGKAHGKTAAQVCLRYLRQRNIVPIPKSVTPARIEENFKIFDFTLSDEEMSKLSGLNKNYRAYFEPIALEHKFYPFNDEF